MKIALLGNMNNNNFAIMRHLRSIGLDAYLILMNNEKAKEFYKKALKKDANNSHAYFNLHSHSKNINTAIKELENCLKFNKYYERAIIMLSALKKLNGDDKLYSEIKIKYPHYNHYFTSYDWYFSLKNIPKLIFNRRDFFDEIIALSCTRLK